MDKEVNRCKIQWENAANCPPQFCRSIGPNGGTATVSYIADPPSVACGKLASVEADAGSATVLECRLTNVPSPIPTLYIKKYGTGTEAKCNISTTA